MNDFASNHVGLARLGSSHLLTGSKFKAMIRDDRNQGKVNSKSCKNYQRSSTTECVSALNRRTLIEVAEL